MARPGTAAATLLVASIAAAGATLGCGGKLFSDSSDDQSVVDADVPPPPPDAGPVVTKVEPNQGPSSGGTKVQVSGFNFATDGGTSITFANVPALSVTCTSDRECATVSPPAGYIQRPQFADVQATVGKQTSKPNANDQFTFAAGPDCRATPFCAHFADPELALSCPGGPVTFYDQNGADIATADAGSTWQAPMTCGILLACYGTPGNGSCAPYSLDPDPAGLQCGTFHFCKDCVKAGGYCLGDSNPMCCNGGTCTAQLPACPSQ